MAISEELQRRIGNLTGERKGSISNREIEMLKKTSPKFGIQSELQNIDNFLNSLGIDIEDTDKLSSKQKLDLSKTAMEMIGKSKGAISDREMNLLMQTSPELSDQQRLNLENTMELIGNTKGAISDREMELFANSSPTNAMELIGNTKGAISDREMEMLMNSSPSATPVSDTAMSQPAMGFTSLQGLMRGAESGTASAINELMAAREITSDPDDLKQIDALIQNMQLSDNAPLGSQAMEIAAQGRGPDTLIGHLEEGDVVIPPDMLIDDPEFETYLEQKFNEYNIDPEERVATTGIAGIYNPTTGMQEFGFLKKLAKGVKKVVKVIAPVAQFIPGPIGAAASIYNKANTVLNVAKGKANPLALLTVAGPMRTGQSFGDSFKTLTGAGGGISGITNQITEGFGNFISDPTGTIGGLFKSQNPEDYMQDSSGNYANKITGDVLSPDEFGKLASRSGSGIQRLTKGLQGNLFGTEGMASGVTALPSQSVDDIANSVPGAATRVERLRASGMSDADIMKDLQFSGYAPQNVSGGFQDKAGNVFSMSQMQNAGLVNSAGQLVSQAANQFLPQTSQQTTTGGGFLDSFLGGSGGDMLKMAGAGLLAGKLGKMAYDETKADKGVSLSPVVAMDATGRYNLEAELARRMGQQAPNPTEFGLLPANTFPQLSGGQPREVMAAAQGGEVDYPNKGLESLAKVAPDVVKQMGYNMGGYVMPMAYAEGGNVSMEDFNRMNGQINGEGTETSDDVPAMLSDGEFVMTGQAVRGAGSYEMNNDSGILTLTPTGSPSRDQGTNMMYQLMEAFSGQARPA